MMENIMDDNKEEILSKVYNYVFINYGLNIRPNPERLLYDDVSKETVVNLDAFIPNSIIPLSRMKKEVLFFLKDIGFIRLDENLRIIEKSLSDHIENSINSQIHKTQMKVEDIIKEYGQEYWGRLILNKTFLSRFYQILNRLQTNFAMSIEEIQRENLDLHIQTLIELDLAEFDPQNTKMVIAGKVLKGLMTKIEDTLRITEVAIGYVINKKSDFLKEKLGIYSFIPYIEIPKIYYYDALIYGELINVGIQEFILKYLTLSGKYGLLKEMSTVNLILEIVSTGLLQYEPSNNSICGNKKVFNEIMQYRDKILQDTNIKICPEI